MDTAPPLSDRRRWAAVTVGLLLLGAVMVWNFSRVAGNLARSASVRNVTDQSLRIVPIGMSPDGPVPLPLEGSDSRGTLMVAPDETLVFRHVPDVATFCWLLVVPPQGPMRLMDTHTDRARCKRGLPPSTSWWHPSAEYFIGPRLEELPPAPPELVRIGESAPARP
ncbi:hypothetical protein [Hyalangium gracile]|uniref:hypothetical protein n=1 Tax=Hyalangium gracile TaxID=394092 RepID=UPI001CCC08C2|nr:hypothetical protein [Hyalangium gracile]